MQCNLIKNFAHLVFQQRAAINRDFC